VSFLLFTQGQAPGSAQGMAQQKLETPVWQPLPERGWKTDLGGENPEVLILKMSNEEFEKFHSSKKAAKDYIDSHHYLKKKLVKVIFCDIVPHRDGKEWYVVVSHTTHSTAVIVGWQIPN
jgi:hypothetical protein